MALGNLTLSTTAGVKGRRFSAVIQGLTTGRVEVLNDGAPGFSVVNGKVSSQSLPYDVSTVVLREYEPGVGIGYRDSRIDISAASAPSVSQDANGSTVVVGGGGGAPSAKDGTATASGAVYTYQRLLGSSSTIALVAGSSSNLTLNTTTGVLSATAAIAVGASQTATVRESLAGIAVEVPITITGASATPTPTPTPGPTPSPSPTPTPTPTPTPSSLRAVSGNNSVPTATTSANTMMNGRSFHYAREALSQITIMIPNFYVDGTDNDVGIGPATVTASVEYPIGSARQQFLFGGQATGTAADKSVAIPDVLTLATPIPKDALFKVRWFYSNPNGILYNTNSGPIMYTSPSGNDGCAFGTALTDLTMSGDVASAQGPGGTGAKLMGILAPSTRRAFGLLTDSRCFGQGVNSDSTGDRGELAPSIGDAYGYLNWAIPGHKVGTFGTAYNAGTGVLRANLMKQYCTDIVDEGGINDLILSPTATAATVVTRKIAMRNIFNGMNYYASTIGGANGTNDSERLAYNSSILGGAITGATAIADIANVVMDAPPAATWKTGYVNADNTHQTATGYAAIKTAGVVKAALGI